MERQTATVEQVAEDRLTLIAMHDATAAKGATNLLFDLLIGLIMVQPESVEEHLVKCEAIARHAGVFADMAWLLEQVVDVVAQMDWVVVSVTPVQQTKA